MQRPENLKNPTLFKDLPLEIIPLIVRHVVRPQHLAQICLVDKAFYSAAIPLLYERTSVFAWHKNAKTKVGIRLAAFPLASDKAYLER